MPRKKAKKKQKKKSARKTQALTPISEGDSLHQYLRRISQYELLSPEEEKALAIRYHKTKDPKAAYDLTVRNLRLVVKIAMEYRKAWSNVLDLIQEGNIGLMTAIQKFDPYRNSRLATYASWWIRAFILKFIMNNWRLIKIGNTQAERKLFYNLKREHERLLQEGFSPGPKLLAERLDVKESDIVQMSHRMGKSELSLDLPAKRSMEGDGRTLNEVIPNQATSMEDEVADQQLKHMIQEATNEVRKTLKPREVILLDRRILAEEPMTLQEIGDEFGVSRERIRQIEERLMKKLRDYMREHYPNVTSSN